MRLRNSFQKVGSGFVILIAIVVVGLTAYTLKNPSGRIDSICIKFIAVEMNRKGNASRNHCAMNLEEVTTEAGFQKGLSGRVSLPSNQGMLFNFKEIDRHCIWMKDMKFNIDIAWLDASAKVIDVKENVSPDTYPESFCQDNTAFVIETKAYTAKAVGITPGAQINL